MYGPIFQVGDELTWKGELTPGHTEPGPFLVLNIKNNDDPRACGCGASRKNGYTHFDDVAEGDCCHELPRQWVTVSYNGNNLKYADGSDVVFCSDWFRKV